MAARPEPDVPLDADVIVIGSGFGGSVSALRLSEKRYRVTVIEAGRRFEDHDLPKTSWDLRRFLWAPRLGWLGIQRIHVLRNVVVLAGAGVGGGSLVYANTLYEPPERFYDDPQWSHITDWRSELAPFYDQAKRMLGVNVNPTMTPADVALRDVAEEMGVGHTFRLAPVGVFFGRNGTKEPRVDVEDPFFGGVGPARTGCRECGACMTGCRHNAKNTLVKNYLYLAERAGARVVAERTVERIRPLADGSYAVDIVATSGRRGRSRSTLHAREVVVAAGAWGTQQLLQQMKADGTLPGLSDQLGVLTRTNSESLCGATASWRNRKRVDYSQGVAITSSIHPDEDTHIEPVRYGHGSNAMVLLSTLLTDGGGPQPRWRKWFGELVRHPVALVSPFLGNWSERTIIGLVMQTRDNSITIMAKRRRKGRIKLTSKQGHGEPNPTWIPVANDAMRRLARHVGGHPGSSVGEIFDVPMTAHLIGGVAIGDSAEHGVIDPYQRVYGHPGLHVIDGSAVAANLGVNPSLTITAQAERAISMWPNAGDPDPRPPLGNPYARISPVTPCRPAVPSDAHGALRLHAQ